MRRIAYERPDGGVSIVIPAFNLNDPQGWTEADSEQRAFDKLPLEAINPRFINPSEVPKDRTFRDAWKPDFTIDLDKAKQIVAKRLTAKELIKLPVIDTTNIDNAKSLDDLKALL